MIKDVIQQVFAKYKEYLDLQSKHKILKSTGTDSQIVYGTENVIINLDKSKYSILGHSLHFKSDTYLNGENENIELPENFL